jgi:hypothetical protein
VAGCSGLATVAAAQESNAPLAGQLGGNTVNAVIFVPRGTTGGKGALNRLMFQAFLRQNGSALVRVWDTARDSYTAPVERKWHAEGTTFCLDIPMSEIAGEACADVHIWGPRIAGTGTGRFFMLDGDIQSGNALIAAQ